MIRRLSFKEYRKIYRERVTEDFPSNERRPLFIVRRMYALGTYFCLALEENGQISAYACFIIDENSECALLDLYAVSKSMRGSGVGSRFLNELRLHLQDKKGIILECERPEASNSGDERHLRERRIDFYKRIGAEITSLDWRAFGVDYNVLWLPVSEKADETLIAKELVSLYSLSLPKAVSKRMLKLKQ